MNKRMDYIKLFMEKNKIPQILIMNPKHIFYLTNFYSEPHERFMGLVITNDSDPTLIIPSLDVEKAANVSNIKNLESYDDTENPYLILNKVLKSKILEIGIEKTYLTVKQFELISHFTGITNMTNIEEPIELLRSQKSEHEISMLKKAIEIMDQSLWRTLKKVEIGIKEIELVAELEYQMKTLGSDGPFGMALFGSNSALPHGIPGNNELKDGDLLLFDMGAFYNGYTSDMTRTFAVGQINKELEDIYQTVLDANTEAINAIKPGVTFSTLDKIARDVISEKGYGKYFNHRLGHGLGMDVHEYPSIHGNNTEKAVENLVVTIEPGIYIPGLGGVRIEDDVLINSTGFEVLTPFPKKLITLPL